MPAHKGPKFGKGKPRIGTAKGTAARPASATRPKKKAAMGSRKPTGSLEFHLIDASGEVPSKKKPLRMVFEDPANAKTVKLVARRHGGRQFILKPEGDKLILEEVAMTASAAGQPTASSPPTRSLGGALLSAAAANETIDPEALADALGLAKGQLASMMGLPSDALYRQERAQAEKTQNRLRELVEILTRVEPWAGGRLQALAWYRGQRIPALGDQTAEALVKTGGADLVRSYLDGIAAGGYE
jgi:hypothetical protein